MKTDAPALILMLAAALAAPGPALAQEPVRSFDQLNTRLKPGDTVYVTDAQGREIKGRILSLGTDALALEGGGRTYGPADVATIQVHRADSLRNGALIGLGIGSGLALAGCLAAELSEGDSEHAGWCVLGAAVYGGVGASIGIGIDALIPGKKIVAYRAPGSAGLSHARLSVAPVVTPRAKGVAVSFAF
jgi:hypothetical protein